MANWKNIDVDFNNKLRKEWKKRGFNYEKTKEWIDAGLKVSDANYARWLGNIKGKNAEWVLNNSNGEEELRSEYKNAQTWLDWNYPQEKIESITDLHIRDQNLIGSLKLKNFTNLKNFNCGSNQLTHLEIINCPNLISIWCDENQLINLKLGKLEELRILQCEDNELNELDISEG